AIGNVIDGSPSTLDTLRELATALGNDPDFSSTIFTQLSQKADLVHNHPWSQITNRPTTLEGYGITNAAYQDHTHAVASASEHGFMSFQDKQKLDLIESQADHTDIMNVQAALGHASEKNIFHDA